MKTRTPKIESSKKVISDKTNILSSIEATQNFIAESIANTNSRNEAAIEESAVKSISQKPTHNDFENSSSLESEETHESAPQPPQEQSQAKPTEGFLSGMFPDEEGLKKIEANWAAEQGAEQYYQQAKPKASTPEPTKSAPTPKMSTQSNPFTKIRTQIKQPAIQSASLSKGAEKPQ